MLWYVVVLVLVLVVIPPDSLEDSSTVIERVGQDAEFGIGNLKGQSVADRAKALISIAHPDYREDLEREARENGLMPKGYF